MDHQDVLLSVISICFQSPISMIQEITVQDRIMLAQIISIRYLFFLQFLIFSDWKFVSPNKDPFKCFGFEWKECDESPLDVIDEDTCPVIEERIEINTEPVRIELSKSLLKSFNELSDDELETSFGSFRPVQSLNPYMTKLSLCSITQVGLNFMTEQLSVNSMQE